MANVSSSNNRNTDEDIDDMMVIDFQLLSLVFFGDIDIGMINV